MSEFIVKFRTDTPSFHNRPGAEIAAVLNTLASSVSAAPKSGAMWTVADSGGIQIGEAVLTDDTFTLSQPKYKIVRFFADERPSVVIKRGVTLEQAQAHCQREDTHGDGWFDGYDLA